jgi:hypothetical protein
VSATAAVDARVALLGRLIDHAPTFPPAALAPGDALAEHRRARASGARFMLNRLVWPASLWDELGDEPGPISAVLDAPAPADSRVESVELRHPGSLDGLDALAAEVYVELPVDAVADLAACRERRLNAKVRCGGASVPSVAELAAFVRACRSAGVAFKATAGLHHPVRRGDEHGFLNLLAAAVFREEEAALAEDDPAAFRLDDDSFAWGGREAGPAEIARARREGLRSIGSCSFAEPVADLQALGFLPV